MNLNDQLLQKQKELAEIQRTINRCGHIWTEPYREQDGRMIPIQENRPMGSDFFNPVTVGWEPDRTLVWRRKCTTCGTVQTTIKVEATDYKPVF